ncbi:MAG: hypothetical protein IJ801_06080 [Lachnospiraceae bacterium]|nr:hypothetical protein [Lachnospiraceae bacterium]MBR1866056.1 hypothetical protein [Lachnospiraceae bacterium]
MHNKSLKEQLQTEYKKFEKIEKEAIERLAKAPEGTVYVNKHRNGVQFYQKVNSKDKKSIYLPVSEKEKAIALVQKKYDHQIAEAAGKQASLLSRFIKNYDPDCLKRIYENTPDIKKNMIIPVVLTDQAYAEQWQRIQFQSKEIGEDVPEHYSNKGERVRSKSEVMIADALAMAGIPYRYECPLMLGNVIIHPDFTILRITDRAQLYWEHLGRMDDPEYVIKNLRKIRLYEQNGIMPGINLILTMETSQQPINLSVIKEMIRTYCI